MNYINHLLHFAVFSYYTLTHYNSACSIYAVRRMGFCHWKCYVHVCDVSRVLSPNQYPHLVIETKFFRIVSVKDLYYGSKDYNDFYPVQFSNLV